MASVTCVAIQPYFSLSTKAPVIEVERCEPIPPQMAKHIDTPTVSPRRDSQQTSTSNASNSTGHSRSASRGTRSRPESQRSSFQSPRRNVNTAIVPVPSSRVSPQEKRETLLALHRESCRLFQDSQPEQHLQRTNPTRYTHQKSRSSTDKESSSLFASPYPTSHFDSNHAPAPPHFLGSRDRANTMPTINPSTSSVQAPPTVMEWTSVDTRRREYEKIDRASSGMRGFWRRVAPRCFKSRDARTPFFEEGKPEREGSVRRFRMDLPDEPCSPSKQSNSNVDGARRRWPSPRNKTRPS